jgi:hypothetical protein
MMHQSLRYPAIVGNQTMVHKPGLEGIDYRAETFVQSIGDEFGEELGITIDQG